jgi:hypothetical protein
VGQTSLWRRTALGPLSAPAPPPEVGGEPSLHPPSVAPAARLEPPPQATDTYRPGLLGRRAHLARDGRGCGPLVATHPPIRPGAAGWASGIPAGSPLLRGPFWPWPFLRGSTPRGFRYSPSGEASFPWGRAEAQPSPQVVPRPPGSGISQGKPVRAFLATAQRQRVRAPQGVRGPPLQPFPLVLARSPPLPRHGFRRPLARSNAALRHRVLPTANARPSSPPPWLRTTRGEVPALERGTGTFPPSRPRRPLSRPFPLRGSGARGTTARDGGAGPQAGCSAKGGSLTLPCSA